MKIICLTGFPDRETKKKWGRIMRLTLFLMVGFLLTASASSYSQNTRLNIKLKNGTVTELMKYVEDNSEFVFLYKNEDLDLKKKVDVELENATIQQVLDAGFKGQNVGWDVYDRQIVIHKAEKLRIPEQPAQQQRTVTGVVTDQSGQPLPGVTVVVTGTTTGTVTNPDGNFSLAIPDGAETLQFSFVGMRTQEMPIEGRTTFTVVMEDDMIGIEEVVAIGYGTQRRREVTSSIATVKEEDFNPGAISSSPLQLVQGKIAGLTISRAHGGDPTRDVHMILRGISTVRGDLTPLIIIDGIAGGNLNNISPEDIESIDVLRDGSAAAIYGTRANAGVIIITTKRGTPGRPSVEYSAYVYTETWLNKPNVLNASEWNQTKIDFQNSGNPLLEARAISIVDYGADTDWFNEITRNVPISQVHNLSFSGGSQTTSYYASLNYRDLQGFILESNNNILNGRLSLTHTGLDEKLTVQMNLSNSLRKSNPVNYQVYRQALGRNPTIPVYNEDGTFFELPGWEMYNPVALLKQFQQDEDRIDLLANTKISYELIKGLKLSASGAIQRSNDMRGEYESRDSWDSVLGGYKGYAERSSRQWIDRTFESTIDYSNHFNGNHGVTGMVGYSYQDFTYENHGASNRYFITDDFLYNNLGAGLHVPQGNYDGDIWSSKNSSKLIAFFGRVNYNFDQKYMLSASLRNEGSSRFGTNNKWGLFPAVSAGWTISREKFMDNLDFIDNLKLRIGYGITGNQGIGNYISLLRLGTAGVMLYDGEWIPGFTPASNPNPNLRWEKKAETNIGIDLTILSNIDLNIDLYNRKTTDLLYEYAVPVPPNLYSTLWTNVGEVNNKGIELTFAAQPVSSSVFTWRTSFNISYNKNMLVSLSNDQFEHSHLDHTNLGAPGLNETHVFRLEEGQPLGNFFGWRHAGFTEDGKWLFWNADRTEKLTAQEVGIEEKAVIGNGLPKSTMGFTNLFTYKNFDLNVALRGSFFFDIVNSRRIFYENVIMIPTNVIQSALDSELVDDPQFSDYYVERGDYLKFDNITFGYNIPIENHYFKQLRVYLSGQNLYTITAYKGQDPELGIEGLSPGLDYRWIYPSVKTFTFGINVKF